MAWPPTTGPRRHGGPYGRGAADSWYGRGFQPHYFEGDSYSSPRVEQADMTPEEVAAYREGCERTGAD